VRLHEAGRDEGGLHPVVIIGRRSKPPLSTSDFIEP
jgi:hypothetical protein